MKKCVRLKVNLAGFHTLTRIAKVIQKLRFKFEVEKIKIYNGEFDPGSGRTLAACLTHASHGRKG